MFLFNILSGLPPSVVTVMTPERLPVMVRPLAAFASATAIIEHLASPVITAAKQEKLRSREPHDDWRPGDEHPDPRRLYYHLLAMSRVHETRTPQQSRQQRNPRANFNSTFLFHFHWFLNNHGNIFAAIGCSPLSRVRENKTRSLLQIPPMDSPQTAVKILIVADLKNKK
jgi:hypothetical protein